MILKSRFAFLGLVFAALLALTACGGGSGGGALSSVGSKGEELAFDPATGSAKAGTAFTVTFKNNSSGQQHNFVLVKGGDDAAAKVDEAAANAAPTYVPQDPNIVASSGLLNGGQEEQVSVPALEAGTYTYICTYPGHYAAGMKGTLTVQ